MGKIIETYYVDRDQVDNGYPTELDDVKVRVIKFLDLEMIIKKILNRNMGLVIGNKYLVDSRLIMEDLERWKEGELIFEESD